MMEVEGFCVFLFVLLGFFFFSFRLMVACTAFLGSAR